MMTSSTDLIGSTGGSSLPALAREHTGEGTLIGAIGRSGFESELVQYLHQLYGADCLYITRVPGGRPEIMTSISYDGSGTAERRCKIYFDARMWRFDPSLDAGRRCSSAYPAVRILDTELAETSELRNFYKATQTSERVLVFGQGPDGVLSLSIVRTAHQGPFSCDQRGRLGLLGEVAFPALLRHCWLQWENKQLLNAVTSLKRIEECLTLAPQKLPRRESQVIARMVFGLTAADIAADLHIGCETVITYRKNIYRRLEVGGLRELLLWYLRLHRDVANRLMAS
jgi:DNA-binding NarL/FixJ family response regulator